MVGEKLRFAIRCFLLPPESDAEELKRRVQLMLPSLLVQVASSRVVQNEALVELIAWQSKSAQAAGCLLAKTPEMDLLLRLSGTTQISRALRESGAKKGEENVLIIAGGLREMRALTLTGLGLERRLKRSELTKDEFMRLERAAMLNALRARMPA